VGHLTKASLKLKMYDTGLRLRLNRIQAQPPMSRSNCFPPTGSHCARNEDTMKFTSALLALFFAASEARSNLMSKAVKVNGSRMLDDAIITGSKSIQFDQCVSVTTQPYNNNIFYNEYNLQAAQNGAIQSQKSFVIFNVCETDSECAYSSQNNLYMVDLGTYVRATMPYLPTKESRYCSVCEMSEEYCQ